MFRILAVSAAIVAIPSFAAAPVAQFNLSCSGVFTSNSMAGEKAEPYAAIYRIDLAQKKWCEGDCKALHEVASVQPAQLTLTEERTDTPSENSFSINTIDRETGAHKIIASSEYRRMRGSIVNLKWEGKCEPAAFTGFPEIATKF